MKFVVNLSAKEIATALKEGGMKHVTPAMVKTAFKSKAFMRAVSKDMKVLFTDTGGDLTDGYHKFFPERDS